MALKRKSKGAKVTTLLSEEEMWKLAEEYDKISAQIKELDSKKKQLATKLKEYAGSNGVTDDKGSSYIEGDSYIVGRVARHSVKIDQDKGVSFLREKGLTECITEKTVYTVNESEVEKAVASENLTEEDVSQFTSVSTSYSVLVKPKEEMSEVELSSVARRK